MEKPSFDQLPQAVLQLHEKLNNIEQILLNQEKSTPQEDQILNIQQAAELIKLSVPTIYGLVQRSAIPVSKQGKRLYFSKDELINWIKLGRKKTAQEINEEAEAFIAKRKVGGHK
ncbi:helix-turn-helix domain-containing protein [Pedobacter cryophilus]|uniref:Helix-turn-helix domain-containing protein n=1 Tax=Pedobacter cryophilus TaxID=2571271 RepID=A0A4U1C969_9SPHI|nr:helix-turn-helix domain-containing protein [Pedobacter cryophilus]TKC00178.1 helix-turn-helix domain-containing protein [Pedobacter cryophilus]